MPKYVIEREVPGAGRLEQTDLQAISRRSCEVLRELGPEIEWLESYVTDDRIYCVYQAASEEVIRRHAERGGFPANRIALVRAVISPRTAEGAGAVARAAEGSVLAASA